MKYCKYCGKEMERPRWLNGQLDSTWENRLFCSSRCYGDWRLSQKRAKRASGRKQAQRILKLTKCEICGSTVGLQRHHKDRNPLNNTKENLAVLCQKCHKEDHLKDGTWGISGFKNRIYRELQEESPKESTDLNVSETALSLK